MQTNDLGPGHPGPKSYMQPYLKNFTPSEDQFFDLFELAVRPGPGCMGLIAEISFAFIPTCSLAKIKSNLLTGFSRDRFDA